MKTVVNSRTGFPLPMQYLGSKQRIAGWILDEVSETFPQAETFVDLMSGTGSVAHEASMRGMGIWANDIQPYSHQVLKAAFESSREALPEIIHWFETEQTEEHLLDGSRTRFADALAREREIFESLQSGVSRWEEYVEFCGEGEGDHRQATGDYDLFSTYYPNTYFGVRQCLEIDVIRQYAATLDSAGETLVVGALISALTFVSSTTTHLAQYLKPASESTVLNLVKRRSLCISEPVLSRLRSLAEYNRPSFARTLNLGYEDALGLLDSHPKSTVVYADPPYFKEHYSRYYHVLDTIALYDYPELTFNERLQSVTVGRYRENRIVSPFGLRSQVDSAFSTLFQMCAERDTPLALSYANTSLLSADHISELAREAGLRVELSTISLRHSGQGQSKAKSDVTEYLFLLTND